MKKLLFIFILILAAGIFAYYLASVQVHPGHVSVVYSGMSGLLPEIFTKEGRHFVPQRLIPGDTEVYSYPKKLHSASKELVFYLPPGKLPVFGRKKDFEVKTVISLQLAMGKKSALLLAAAGYKTIGALSAKIISQAGVKVREKLALAADSAIREGRVPDLAEAVKTAIPAKAVDDEKKNIAVYGISLDSLTVSAAALPDARTYIQLRKSLAKTHPELAIRLRNHYRDKAELIRLKKKNDEELRRLTGIAALVTKYPGLINYMAVTRLSRKLRIALIQGSGDRMQADLYKRMLDRLVNALPASKPVNINIRNGKPAAAVKTAATNK